MKIDQLAKQTHRRGFIAAMAALAIPATASAQQLRCSPRGGGCTLSVHCCGSVKCYREPLNPNSGVCGGVFTSNEGPSFIVPTNSGSSGSESGGGSGRLNEAQLIARYDRNRSGDIDCDDFECQEDAQALHDAYPGNPWRLDGNSDGVACERNTRCQS